VIEEEVDLVVLSIDFKGILAPNEGESDSEL
jgi:hypothetical protein